MSSYVANSFYKQSQNASAYTMQSYGNYGSVSEVQSSRYCYSGLDLSMTFPSSGSSNSLGGLDMSSSPRNNPERPACTVMGSSGHSVARDDQTPLTPGIYSQKAGNTALEDRSKSTSEIKAEPVQTAQHGGQQPQQPPPPQIYPWMTKLHMSHETDGKRSRTSYTRYQTLELEKNFISTDTSQGGGALKLPTTCA